MRASFLILICFLLIGCSYRWTVKTMSDNEIANRPEGSFTSKNVLTNSPIITTIDSLVKLPRPVQQLDRTFPETQLYTITGKITFWTIEPDKDVHMVIRSGTAHMICEIPNPSKAANSVVLEKIKNARKEFMENRKRWPKMK